MAQQCAFDDEPVSANYLFTDLSNGETTPICAPHLPEWLAVTLDACIKALEPEGAGPEPPNDIARAQGAKKAAKRAPRAKKAAPKARTATKDGAGGGTAPTAAETG